MAATTFTQSKVIDLNKEKGWGSDLGMLDWDITTITFTKRSLIEFLRYTGTTVDTNFSNIQKLPKYAQFGTFQPALPEPGEIQVLDKPVESEKAAADAFIPSRRVRTAPGGPHTDIFGEDFQKKNDALSMAPPKEKADTPAPAPAPAKSLIDPEHEGIDFSATHFKPTRRVRDEPGGGSAAAGLWDAPDEPAAAKPVAQEAKPVTKEAENDEWAPKENTFKPSRRVRDEPGGGSASSGFWAGDEDLPDFKPSRRVRAAPGGGTATDDFF